DRSLCSCSRRRPDRRLHEQSDRSGGSVRPFAGRHPALTRAPRCRFLVAYQSRLEKASTHSAPAASASATSTSNETTTPWILNRQVIPNLPLCFSNYVRSGTKYDEIRTYLIIQV